ncbi:hypothetical protein ACQKL5_05065 [Peribacillus sp. NPDC097675]|uniref:hypothetical protein n=1 Tax=Peribacillus sp. NPDC097675 TaxID=3390618 RepID=UPI003D06F4F4
MKKIWSMSILMVVLLLTACSGEEQTVSTENGSATNTKAEQKDKKEAKVEIIQETFGAWKDSIDSVWVNYSAEVKNTGNAPASLRDIQINFEGEDGSVLGTASMITATPEVIMPGETAYIGESTILESVKDPKLLNKAYSNIDFDTTDEEPVYLKTENVKVNALRGDFSDNPYSVTGNAINDGDEKADDIRLASGLYDEEGNLLGVLNGSLDIGLNAGGKTGFELNYPELPATVKGKAKEVKTIAYSWKW